MRRGNSIFDEKCFPEFSNFRKREMENAKNEILIRKLAPVFVKSKVYRLCPIAINKSDGVLSLIDKIGNFRFLTLFLSDQFIFKRSYFDKLFSLQYTLPKFSGKMYWTFFYILI